MYLSYSVEDGGVVDILYMYLSYSVEDGGVVDTVHVSLIQCGGWWCSRYCTCISHTVWRMVV